MTNKMIIIGMSIAFGTPLAIIFMLWLNNYLLERERRKILLGIKPPWGFKENDDSK